MKNSSTTHRLPRLPRGKSLIFVALLALILLLAYTPVLAKEGELGKDELACLACHDKPGFEKKLSNGETLSLQISTKAYAESLHNSNSCADCHADIDTKTHGKEKKAVASKRELGIAMRDTCRDCHKKKFTEYDDSVHAAVIKEGSKRAPLCADCHNPHTVRSWKIAEPDAATPCAKCHVEIFKASAQDVHGKARGTKETAAPICAGCHKSHGVKAASLGTGLKDTCLACHKEALKEHQEWLPKAELHFEAISCPVCHAPDAQRRVNLRLFDGVGEAKHQMSEKSGVPRFEKRVQAADTTNTGLDERALWSLLKEFNQDGGEGKTVLRGRLEVKSGVEAHQLSDKSRAIKDCKFCHQAGAEPFQSVTLTIAGPDGRPLRHGVQKEVLNSALSVESIRGFYVIGSTRIKLLDVLLVLVVVGSIVGPLMHMLVKRLFKGFRERRAAEIRAAVFAATAQPQVQPVPGDLPNRDGNNR